MKKLASVFVANIISLFVINYLVPGISIELGSLLILALLICLLNITLKPFLKLISLPITILTLGLFSFVINVIVLLVAFKFVPGADYHGLFSLLLASLLLSVFNSVLNRVFK